MSAEILHVTDDNFDSEVLSSDLPVLVDFWAEWCGPCKMLGPVIEEVANENDGKAVVAKLNVDEASELASKFGVQSIPTLIVFKDGEAVNRLTGVQSKSVIQQALDAA